MENSGLIRLEDSFDYLIRMPMVSVSIENVEKLMNERGDINHELEALRATTIQQMWISELDDFEKVYNVYVEKRKNEYSIPIKSGEGAKSKKSIIKKVTKK